MPLYEYECADCHRRTEKIQKFSDAELTVCPHCGGPLARTITAPAFQFAGGGWYKDGYGSAKPSETGGSGDAGKGEPGKAGETSTAKPAESTAAAAPAAAAPAPSAPSTTTAKS